MKASQCSASLPFSTLNMLNTRSELPSPETRTTMSPCAPMYLTFVACCVA